MEITDEEIISYVDKLTKFNLYGEFNLNTMLSYIYDVKGLKSAYPIRNKMVDLGYIEIKNKLICIPTELLKTVKSAGGHYEYIAKLELEEQKVLIKYHAEIKSLNSTTNINEWLLKTKWLPHIFSGLALAISVVALIYAVKTYNSEQSKPTKVSLEEKVKSGGVK